MKEKRKEKKEKRKTGNCKQQQQNTNKHSLLIHFFFLLFSFFILHSSFVFAMTWPSEDAVLIRNFGANDRGKPNLGMVFSGGTAVLAAERGEIIYTRSKNDPNSRLPSPLGAWTAIDHGDGLISVYSRYADFTDSDANINTNNDTDAAENTGRFTLSTFVEKSQQIAYPGISGWSSRDGFNFMIIDRRERRWVNPAMIITPVQRLRNPQILSVELRNAQGQTVQSRNINQDRYTVLVNTISHPQVSQTSGISLIPQRIICLVNGAESASLNFESFSARDGSLMVYRNGLVPASQIYSKFPSFEASEVFFTRGQATLEIIVQDIAGNSSSSIMRLAVN